MGELKFQTIKNAMTHYTGMKISDKSVRVFTEIVESFVKEMAEQSAKFAGHAKRQTIREEDVLLAREVVKRP